jgi:hypothetical protein
MVFSTVAIGADYNTPSSAFFGKVQEFLQYKILLAA